MTRFAIAGIQMRVSATEDNVATMRHRLATLMAIYPWVRMVVFSELAVADPCHSPPCASRSRISRRKRR